MKNQSRDNEGDAPEDFIPEDNGEASDLDDSVVAEEAAAATIKKLREKLKKTETERQEYLTGWQRVQADMVNARKRDEAERNEFIRFANERLIENLIPVLESFDMAMSNKEAWEKADKSWRTGVEYIHSQLMKVLTESGLVELNPAPGEKFDHARHEASSYEPVKDPAQDHVIIGVVQKGYALNGKELRAPKVKVGEYKAADGQ